MKRFVAAVIIFVVIVLAAALPSLYTDRVCGRMRAETEKLRLTADGGQAERVSETWNECERKMRFYIKHDELEAVSEIAELLVSATESGNRLLVSALCTALDGKLERIRDSERASAGNIF